ncbi:hypothetical protein BH24DEI2_BH24DEI2_23810 [soil metagenome]
MNDSLGVLVVGAGDMGTRHALHWTAAGAKVVAVCDPDVKRAQASADVCAALVGADYREWLTRDDINVVSVCTPTFLHAPITIDGLNAGKHVLCEKPIALTLEDARAMKNAAETNDRELRIGFMRRFDPSYPVLLGQLDAIGGPVLGRVTVTAGIRPKRLMHAKNANGGPVIDMCCHLFDMWKRMFEASPRLVHVAGHTYGADKPQLAGIKDKAVESAAITLQYGANTVQLLITWGLPEGVLFREKHVYVGPGGLVEASWDYLTNPAELSTGAGVTRFESGRDPWAAEIRQFYKELTEGAERQVADADDGVEALELSLQVLEAVA